MLRATGYLINYCWTWFDIGDLCSVRRWLLPHGLTGWRLGCFFGREIGLDTGACGLLWKSFGSAMSNSADDGPRRWCLLVVNGTVLHCTTQDRDTCTHTAWNAGKSLFQFVSGADARSYPTQRDCAWPPGGSHNDFRDCLNLLPIVILSCQARN